MYNSKLSLFIALICVVFCSAVIRNKRQTLSYTLPDGVEEFAKITVTSFRCGEQGGYFADVEADCKLFHVCLPQEFPDGKRTVSQFTFACGNQTVFNQFSLTCAHPDEAVPCNNAPDFFYLNQRIGQKDVNIHNDEDLEKLSSVLSKH